jgi:hypothetical protein
MRTRAARRAAAALGLGALIAAAPGAPTWTAGPAAAQPFEYRLKVASLHEDALLSRLAAGETGDASAGRGLDALAAWLDAGEVPRAALLVDRHLRATPEETARAWSAAPRRLEVKLGGGRGDPWDEVRWDGAPGAHTIWTIAAAHRQPQEVHRLALKGLGQLRHYRPYVLGPASRPFPAIVAGLAFVRSRERSGQAWAHFSRALDLGDGIAAVVVEDEDAMWPDRVYLVVRHADRPMEYRAVLGWKTREADRESPGWQ